MEHKGSKLRLITSQNGKIASDKNYSYKVSSLQRINKNNFVINEKNSSNIRLLTIDYAGNSQYEDKIIWRDTANKIVKILANNNNLYVLSNSGSEYFFRCFNLKQNLDLVAHGLISNVELRNPTFIQEFLSSNMINENILVSNMHKFVKIYDDDNASIDPSLQNYFSFLPEPISKEKDRSMPRSLLRNCPKHSRLLMQFNYPISCKPKQALITPSIGVNTITMNSQTDRSMISWLSNKNERAGSKAVTRIFQFLPAKMILNEFDLVGLVKKQTKFAKDFKRMHVLAVDSQKLRYMVTPEAERFLKEI